MLASSQGQGEQRSAQGIISGHAYSIIAAYNINASGQNHKILKLRNPWGGSEWQGAWSDSDSRWTPALRQQMDIQRKEDGIFCMPFDDYLRNFRQTSITVEVDTKKYHHTQKLVDLTQTNTKFF